MSFDQKLFGSAGVTLTGYFRERNQEPESRDFPSFATAQQGGRTIAYYVDMYQLYMNDGWTQSKGLEFSLRTGNIRPLNMEFRDRWLLQPEPERDHDADVWRDSRSRAKGNTRTIRYRERDTLIGWWYPSPDRNGATVSS